MDEKIAAYIQSLVLNVLNSPSFGAFSDEQKKQYSEKVEDNFNNIIFDTVIEMLSDEQVGILKTLQAGSLEFERKLEEFSSTIPLLSTEIEKRLNQQVENIKNNPNIITAE